MVDRPEAVRLLRHVRLRPAPEVHPDFRGLGGLDPDLHPAGAVDTRILRSPDVGLGGLEVRRLLSGTDTRRETSAHATCLMLFLLSWSRPGTSATTGRRRAPIDAELPDRATRVLHQAAHGGPGPVRLAAADGVEDRLVARQRGAGKAGDADGRVERDEQRRVHDRAHLLEDLVVAGLHDGPVEADVGLVVGLVVGGRQVERRPHVAQGGLQRRELRRPGLVGRQLRRPRLDDQPHLRELAEEGGRGQTFLPPRQHVGIEQVPGSGGRTRVPVLGRDTTRPLAARTLTASRTTPRLARTPAGVGSCSPGRISPVTMRRPMVCTMRPCSPSRG